MKKYIKPATEMVTVRYENEILAASPNPGVVDDSDIIDEFDEGDESYTKPVITDIWKGDGDTENEWQGYPSS